VTRRPLIARLDAALIEVERLTAFVGGLTIFVLMVLVTANVVLRRLFNAPVQGVVDIVTMSMVTFGVLCISFCYREAGHIRMDMVLKVLSGRVAVAANLAVTLVALFTVTAILPGTWTHFQRAYEFGDSTFGIGLVTWPSKLAVPVGLAILWLRLVLEIFVWLRLMRDPAAEPFGVPTPGASGDTMDA